MFAYTEDDLKYIKDNYKTMSDEEIGNKLHRGAASIKEYRRKNKLFKPHPEGVIYGFDQYIHVNNKEWKRESAKNCGYKCIITDGSFDDIHHLYAKNLIVKELMKEHPDIDWEANFNDLEEREKKYIVDLFYKKQNEYPLGVCLRHDIHKDFHDRYGYGNNTPEQFIEFVKSIAPDRVDIIDVV